MAALVRCLLLATTFVSYVSASMNSTESPRQIVLSNDRLYATLNKSTGAIDTIFLDGQDLLTSSGGSRGVGPYLDCYCIPSGFYTPGSIKPYYKFYQGVDGEGVAYAGALMGEVYPPTGQVLEQYWFLRDGETGLHSFSRIAYHNETTPFLRNLQEFRTLFRPQSTMWTHLSTNEDFYGPAPVPNPASTGTGIATVVQDATWYLGNRTNDPYVDQVAEYFTKYTFSNTWRDLDAHGLFADGSKTPGNLTYGAWMVMNTKDTYFGGPTHSDLLVDGIVYNYMVSNHHGDNTPNITDGFDRTFGPQYYYFNKGAAGTSLDELRDDAASYAYPEFAAAFYDSIAEYVPNYVPTSGRGSWKAQIELPRGGNGAVAILTQNGVDYQDNVLDSSAYQYWADITDEGSVEIPLVKAGTYRLTIYTDGIFGQYEQDDIVVTAGEVTDSQSITWTAESAGSELWRIGYPDKSSGEYRHGRAPDSTHPLHPPEYRIYWAKYDYVDEFPEGVNFHVGESDEAVDLNYVHWSVFGGYANSLRPNRYYGNGNVNNWTLTFDLEADQLKNSSLATFTVQLAGAKTAAGNTDVLNATQQWSNLPLTAVINGKELEPWIIP